LKKEKEKKIEREARKAHKEKKIRLMKGKMKHVQEDMKI
jgi:hypothetical protein